MTRRLIACSALMMLFSWSASGADETPATKAILVDAAGKEVPLAKWTIAFGTRKLSWTPTPLEVLEVREVNSTTFKEGILTFVPLSRLKAIDYDYEKQTISVEVAGVMEPVIGSTKFAGVNQVVIEAEANVSGMGVADVKYRGGVVKGGFKSLKFPDAKAVDTKEDGELYTIQIAEAKGKGASVVVRGLQPLYQIEKSEKLIPSLMFKKTLKIDFEKIQKLRIVMPPDKVKMAECEVVTKDGQELGLTLLSIVPIDGKNAVLIGLVGRVPGGYRLFPMHTISEFQIGEVKEDKDEK